MVDGACVGTNPDLWFPGRGESIGPAIAICQECPVRVTCLNHALDHGYRYGIWGGKSERERRRMRVRRRLGGVVQGR